MKKSLIALATLAATGAFAQSTVTLTGVIQAGYQQHISAATANYTLPGSTSTAPTTAVMTKGQVKGFTLMDRAFTLTVLEDLGGGLAAFGNTKMENASDFRGAQLGFADTNLGLRSSAWGEFKFTNTRSSDTFAAVASSAISLRDGLYDDSGITSRGAIDVVTYTTPDLLPGLKASVAFVEGNDGDINVPANDASVTVLGAMYVNGPVTVMGAYKSKAAKAAASTASGYVGQISKDNIELAARYDLGFAVVGLGYDGASTKTTIATPIVKTGGRIQTDKDAFGASLTVPMGAFSMGAEFWSRGKATESRFGAMYALSKRTALTAAYGLKDYPKINNSTNVTSNNQYRLSVLHTF
jgi:predicted porin